VNIFFFAFNLEQNNSEKDGDKAGRSMCVERSVEVWKWDVGWEGDTSGGGIHV
jgi:hypothetical protein